MGWVHKKTLHTSTEWTCDGQKAVSYGANGVGPWGHFPAIDSSAQWIWQANADNTGASVCSYTIPPQPLSNQNMINLTVDNYVDYITVNGAAVDISGFSPDWPVLKTAKLPAFGKPGDIIVISGKNLGGPAGIIATITYFDGLGEKKTLHTSTEWTCDGQKAVSYGANGVGPWGHFAAIDSSAQWIWQANADNTGASVCSYTIPSGKCLKWA